MAFDMVFKNTSEISDQYELKQIICELESKIFELRYTIDEERGRYWVLEQILQHTGKLTTLEKLFESFTDILMGVFGASSCKVYVEIGGNLKCFARDTESGGRFYVTIEEEIHMVSIDESKSFAGEEIEGLEHTASKNGTRALMISPLFNYKEERQIGFIALSHMHEGYFTEKLESFFNTLAIQISVVAENAIMYEEIMDVSKKDTLTKCYNRKYYNEIMRKLGSKSYSMAVYDLDNFKYVNDNFGHERGDDILVDVAQMSFDAVRPYEGSVIRYGGDEFIIIMYEDLYTIKTVMEQLSREVESRFKAEGLPITITAGIASYPLTTDNEKELFLHADMALVTGKKKGKNRIYVARGENSQAGTLHE